MKRSRNKAFEDPPVLHFEIPPGPLSVALRLFEQATGLSVRVAPDLVRDLTSPGARGMLTADNALRQLLSDSQLTHRLTGNGTVVVEVRPVSEDVQVVANALPVVTSPKFTAPLLDTPQTVTIVPKELIEAQGATTLREILRNVPGITMQAGEGGGGLPGDTLTHARVPGDQRHLRGRDARRRSVFTRRIQFRAG